MFPLGTGWSDLSATHSPTSVSVTCCCSSSHPHSSSTRPFQWKALWGTSCSNLFLTSWNQAAKLIKPSQRGVGRGGAAPLNCLPSSILERLLFFFNWAGVLPDSVWSQWKRLYSVSSNELSFRHSRCVCIYSSFPLIPVNIWPGRSCNVIPQSCLWLCERHRSRPIIVRPILTGNIIITRRHYFFPITLHITCHQTLCFI